MSRRTHSIIDNALFDTNKKLNILVLGSLPENISKDHIYYSLEDDENCIKITTKEIENSLFLKFNIILDLNPYKNITLSQNIHKQINIPICNVFNSPYSEVRIENKFAFAPILEKHLNLFLKEDYSNELHINSYEIIEDIKDINKFLYKEVKK